MKRSEMVELLAVQFMKYCNGSTTPEKVGNYLLRCCEENGMQPPAQNPELSIESMNFIWEPEDV